MGAIFNTTNARMNRLIWTDRTVLSVDISLAPDYLIPPTYKTATVCRCMRD